jgi:integrase
MPRKVDHLRWHRGKWQVRIAIPADARPALGGKTCLIETLGPDLNAANLLKGSIVTRFQALILEARSPGDPFLKEARAIRRQLDASRGDEEEMEAQLLANRLGDRIEEEQGGNAARNAAYKIAVGFNAPLDHYIGDWLADRGFTGKTEMQHRKAFTVLSDWCNARSIEPTLEAVTRRVALDFIAKYLHVHLAAPKTINRYLSTYRTHWAWLIRQDRVTANPWEKTHVAERNLSHEDDDDGARPFKDNEVRTLLTAAASPPLPDLMMVAALTGARIDAICNLRVRDCAGGNFNVRKAKKEKRARTVPIHPRLRSIVARRRIGKEPDEFLFHELPAATATRPRSAAASQSFTRYRRTVGVDERPDGQRQSNVNFHSWRRWFITKAEQAGQHPHIIEAVVGHRRSGMSMGVYSGGPSEDQLRACVEAVKLPSLPAKPPKAPVRHATRLPSRPRKKRIMKRRKISG